MINLIICISSLIIGLFIVLVDYNFNYNIKWINKTPKFITYNYIFISIILVLLRFICFFSFGFFIMETIKYFNGQPTIFF